MALSVPLTALLAQVWRMGSFGLLFFLFINYSFSEIIYILQLFHIVFLKLDSTYHRLHTLPDHSHLGKGEEPGSSVENLVQAPGLL